MFLIVKFVTLNATLWIPASISAALRRKVPREAEPADVGIVDSFDCPVDLTSRVTLPVRRRDAHQHVRMAQRHPPAVGADEHVEDSIDILTRLLVEGDDGFDVDGVAKPVENRQRLVQIRRRHMVEAIGQVLEEGNRVVCREDVANRIPASRVVLGRRFLFGQETEVVLHSLLVSLGVLEQV